MKISNLNLRNAIRWIVGVLLFVVAVDLVMVVFFNEFLDRFFTGYSAVAVPLLLIAAYSYVGLPIFSLNDHTNLLQVRSHLALGKFFGKELLVNKKNIVKMTVDRDRVRKKLRIHYLDAGVEKVETFSITLLGNDKIRKLAREVELIESEARGGSSQHLFI